ncbi:MAG TPA: TolC family protein [Acidobacteriota bacterium]|nr:TolC family protein [Acidobacteriota bacterium]
MRQKTSDIKTGKPKTTTCTSTSTSTATSKQQVHTFELHHSTAVVRARRRGRARARGHDRFFACRPAALKKISAGFLPVLSFYAVVCVAAADRNEAAAPPAIPRQLSLGVAEDLLLQRNLVIATSRYQIEAARAARLIASYKPNPLLTVGGEQIPFYSPLRGSAPRFFATDSNAGANPVYTLRVDKIIERGGKRKLRTELADFQIKASEAQLLDSIRIQLFQLRQAFTAALLAQENARLAEMIQDQYAGTERLTKIKVDNGDLAGVELYRVRAGRLQYQQMVLQARTAYEQAARDLINILAGRPEESQTPATTGTTGTQGNIEYVSQSADSSQARSFPRGAPLEVVGTFSAALVSHSLAELRQIAISERPDVIAARNSLEASGRAFLLAKAQRARDLDVASEYQRVGDDHSLGVVLQIPLFTYNNQQAAIQQAQAQRRAAETQLRQIELQALTDVEKAFIAHQSARRMLDLYNNENLKNLDSLRNITAVSYREGAVSLFEVLDVQRTYNQAITAYNQARADYQMSLWQIEQATGRPLQ